MKTLMMTEMLAAGLAGLAGVAGDAPGRIKIEERYLSEVPAVQNAAFQSWNTPYPTRGIFFEGPAYRGKPTRVFAFIGVPELPEGEKVPGIVLVHGGGGTAFREWVELWMARGYAAIAMDLCGHIPVYAPDGEKWLPVGADGGPEGWDAAFAQTDLPLTDQWPNVAVNTIARARTLLGSQPGVDPERIAITGVSWGGYLTCLTAALDSRYVFAAPVYGCGFLREKSLWSEPLRKPEMARWSEECDPAAYLAQVSMPILWVGGTNDVAYPLESLDKSTALVTQASVTRSITLRMPHGHGGAGERPEIVRIMADYYCKGTGAPLPEISDVRVEAGVLHAKGRSALPVTRAELLFTGERESAECDWTKVCWESYPAKVSGAAGEYTVTVRIPDNAVQYVLNVFDERDVPVTSRLFVRE